MSYGRLYKDPWEQQIEKQILTENKRQLYLHKKRVQEKREMLGNLQRGNNDEHARQQLQKKRIQHQSRRDHHVDMKRYHDQTVAKEQKYREFYRRHMELEKQHQKYHTNYKQGDGATQITNQLKDKLYTPTYFNGVHRSFQTSKQNSPEKMGKRSANKSMGQSVAQEVLGHMGNRLKSKGGVGRLKSLKLSNEHPEDQLQRRYQQKMYKKSLDHQVEEKKVYKRQLLHDKIGRSYDHSYLFKQANPLYQNTVDSRKNSKFQSNASSRQTSADYKIRSPMHQKSYQQSPRKLNKSYVQPNRNINYNPYNNQNMSNSGMYRRPSREKRRQINRAGQQAISSGKNLGIYNNNDRREGLVNDWFSKNSEFRDIGQKRSHQNKHDNNTQSYQQSLAMGLRQQL